jgi:molecular chaperone DnaK
LSDADIEKMVQDAENMRDADQKKKDTVQAKNDGETLGYQVEKQLSELKEKMSTADADELKKKLEDLRTVLASEEVDLEEVKAKTSELQEKSWAVTQAAYQQGGGDQATDSSNEQSSKDEKKDEKK